MNVTLRKATAEDFPLLAELARQAFLPDREKYGCGPDYLERPESIREHIEQGIVWCICADGEPVGSATVFTMPEEHRCWLGAIFLGSAWQNAGIGGKAIELVEAAYPWADTWGLDTPYASYRNHHFYEKHGYRVVKKTEPEENGFYLFVYEKKRPAEA